MRLLALAAAAVAGFVSTAEAVWTPGVKLYGINYDMQICKENPDDERADLEAIAKISDRVRIYGLSMKPKCPVTRLLDTAKRLKLKVAMGMWLDNVTHFETQLKGLDEVLATGKVDSNVIGFHVGSEAIYRKDHTAEKAIYYLEETRKKFKNRGINMKLTIADVVDSYYQYPELLQHVDYVSINQFSFWERVDPATGMNKMLDRIRSIRAEAAKVGKEVIISETGWPSDGNSKGGGEPSLANQRTFFSDFYHQMTAHDIPYYWFVAYDALWYTWVHNTVEMHFGVMNPYSRQIKPSYQNVDFTKRTITTIQSPRGLLGEAVNKKNVEKVEGLEITQESADKLEQFRYKWFWDAAKMQFRSVNSDRCLDAYVENGEYIVHSYTCYEGNPNQQWSYNVATQQIQHANHKGYCLEDADSIQLAKCDAGSAKQRWGIGSAPGRTCSTIEDGLDFIGNDVGNKAALKAEDCCVHCAAFKGCNAFTWTNHAGGTCWLKSGRGSTTFTAGARSAVITTITPTPTTPTPTTPTPTTPTPTTPTPTTPTPTTPKPTTPAPSTCSIENDVDYTGNDVGNKKSSKAEGCCEICQKTVGCKAFSWNNYEGGTCWLKSGKGTTARKAGVRSGVVASDVTPTPTTPTPTTPAPGSCPTIENNIDYVGNDVGNARSDTAEGCCSLCSVRSNCKAFSWNDYMGGTCWFKSGKGAFITKAGTRSAVMSAAPACSKIEEGVDYSGADVGNVTADKAEKCCDLCRASNKGCKAYTWTNYNGGTCWLKSAKGSAVVKAGARSAMVL